MAFKSSVVMALFLSMAWNKSFVIHVLRVYTKGQLKSKHIDLLGRKVLGTQGAMLKDFTKIIHKFAEANKDNAAMQRVC